MVSDSSRLNLYFNTKLKEKLLQNFGTSNIKEIQEIILKYLENPDSNGLPLKDQILIEKLAMIREQRPLQLRKLTAQTEILESRVNFQKNFKIQLSNNGSQILSKSINQKYNFGNSPRVEENIQYKKNFFIDKHTDGSYVGVCKVCQNFVTDVCTTSREAEGDIELHLEAVHHRELYQK